MPNVTFSPESGDILAGMDQFNPTVDQQYIVYNIGNLAFIYVGAVLVMVMASGVGFLYSGLLRRKNALQMLFMSMVVYAVGTIQFFLFGYSLAFGENVKGHFIGSLTYGGINGVLSQPSNGNPQIPALLFFLYESMFAAVTPVIAFGAIAERGRFGPMLLIAFVFCSLVYDPVSAWTWNAGGWLYQLGGLDFAGGGPVHITSGTASLAYSIFLGRRHGHGTPITQYKPHNVIHVVLGTVLLWFGWFGFNGGSELAMNLRSVNAGVVTNIAAAMGGLTWMLMDYRLERKWSAVGFCSGAVAGLVGITPASGYVGAPAALAIGAVTAVVCNFATGLKNILRVDDVIDIFALHGVGGYCGAILTGLFADSRIAAFDGTTVIAGGWINHHYVQLGYQLAGATAIMAWSFVITYITCFVVNYIPGCRLRATEDAEILGMDLYEYGEMGFDYAFIEHGDNKSALSQTSSAHGDTEKLAGTTSTQPVPERQAEQSV